MTSTNTKGQLASDRAKRAAERKARASEATTREAKIADALKKGSRKVPDYTARPLQFQYHGGHTTFLNGDSVLRTALLKSDKLLKTLSTFDNQLKQLDTYCQRHLGAGYRQKAETWKPAGKGAKTHLHSLINHLLVTYKVPDFMYAAFRETNEVVAQAQIDLFHRLASGDSLYKLVGSPLFPPPFTRKMCHRLTTLGFSSFSVAQAVRHVQGEAFEGDRRIVSALTRANALSRTIHNPPETEAFWQSVVQWFCVHAKFFNPNMVNPVVDYLNQRHNENHDYSMKGRTPNSIIRDMNEWHKKLGLGDVTAHEYTPSGLKTSIWEISDPKMGDYKHIWTVGEILSGKDLVAEGRALHHCVASYATQVAKSKVSIWSMRHNGERVATIEVFNAERKITQARGLCNRSLNNDEKKYLKLWAQNNNLEIGAYL